ncbi:coiled-coil domain-containing protein 187 isoform X2 [Dunckerocampus dactyliophorus]|uniref:coiled-coil domain-containing protein 187 isoform X2 n=1 Tax=Dunckerocampus dactyliophorus TaxID=161453 RepID=UPI0024057A08|nr:coiled-coil domain-containing protein 187 isoform X2 [Dunckerocampus dactyliophorus]
MAEVQIDQSSLPRVQEVCQSFAVLEDGVLAHNLQEQEIEQYYTTNIQKNQLVQNDIRVAKQLQDEEEVQQAQQSALLRQESRQLEEQDFEYARLIQEEIKRTSEEAWRREHDDEEMARRMQEEEEQRMRRTREQEEYFEGSSSGSAPPSPNQFTLHQRCQREAQYSPTTTRWQYSNTSNRPDYCRPPVYYPGRVTDHNTITSWSDEGHTNSHAALRRALEETQMHADCEDSVYLEQLPNKRHNTAPLYRRSSLRLPQERDYRTLYTPSSITEEFHCCDKYYENDDKDKRRARDWEQERSYRLENGAWTMYSHPNGGSRSVAVGERPCRRSESVRLHDSTRQSSRDSSRTWTYRDNPDKHVHFAADIRSSNKHQDTNMEVWEMLGHVLKERGVPVRLGGSGAPLKIGPQSRDSQALHSGQVSYGDSQPHQTPFQRAASARHSFHGDIRERRRLSHRENIERDNRGSDYSHYGELCEIGSRDSSLSNREMRGNRCWKEHRSPDYEYESRSSANNGMVRRTAGRHWHNTIERFNSKEEMERGVEQPLGRALGSSWARSRSMAAGTSLTPKKEQTSFNMGALQQVLQDEELARKLQEEESQLFARTPRRYYPQGDFRVAQVAQDEEIAHYMQNQEVKSNRRSRELEGPASWREHRAMMSHHDRRTARERQVHRERLDSEGLPSPTEDCPPENQPSSIISTLPQSQQLRNIAEELDPTFQARSQGADILQMGQTGPISQSLPTNSLHDFPEEPTFIPPTKRPAEKPGRAKPKEKKENSATTNHARVLSFEVPALNKLV